MKYIICFDTMYSNDKINKQFTMYFELNMGEKILKLNILFFKVETFEFNVFT